MKGPKQSLLGLFLLVLLASCSLQQLACAQYEPNLSCTLDGQNSNDCVRALAAGAMIYCCDLGPVDFDCLCAGSYDSFPDIDAPYHLIDMGYDCGFSLPESCMNLVIKEKGGKDFEPSGAGSFQ